MLREEAEAYLVGVRADRAFKCMQPTYCNEGHRSGCMEEVVVSHTCVP